MENKSYKELKEKLDDIIKKSIYPLKGKGSGECGMLLEKLLGIEANSFSVADIDGIELKVHSINSLHPITLFSCTFDGPNLFEIRRIVERYGMNVNGCNSCKILYVRVSAIKFFNWGRYLKFKLYLDDKTQKLFLIVAHSNGKIIEKKSYWEYSTLFSILERKLKQVCFVSIKTSYVGGVKFVEFIDYSFFKLKSFDHFIFGLKTGKIIINIKYGAYKYGERKGMPYDHGISFQINKEDINILFDFDD